MYGGFPKGKKFFGLTPLMIACMNNCVELVELLIEKGAIHQAYELLIRECDNSNNSKEIITALTTQRNLTAEILQYEEATVATKQSQQKYQAPKYKTKVYYKNFDAAETCPEFHKLLNY